MGGWEDEWVDESVCCCMNGRMDECSNDCIMVDGID